MATNAFPDNGSWTLSSNNSLATGASDYDGPGSVGHSNNQNASAACWGDHTSSREPWEKKAVTESPPPAAPSRKRSCPDTRSADELDSEAEEAKHCDHRRGESPEAFFARRSGRRDRILPTLSSARLRQIEDLERNQRSQTGPGRASVFYWDRDVAGRHRRNKVPNSEKQNFFASNKKDKMVFDALLQEWDVFGAVHALPDILGSKGFQDYDSDEDSDEDDGAEYSTAAAHFRKRLCVRSETEAMQAAARITGAQKRSSPPVFIGHDTSRASKHRSASQNHGLTSVAGPSSVANQRVLRQSQKRSNARGSGSMASGPLEKGVR